MLRPDVPWYQGHRAVGRDHGRGGGTLGAAIAGRMKSSTQGRLVGVGILRGAHGT